MYINKFLFKQKALNNTNNLQRFHKNVLINFFWNSADENLHSNFYSIHSFLSFPEKFLICKYLLFELK